MDYGLPRAGDVPPLDVASLDYPSAVNDLGIKGVGESGVISPSAAIANAVEDALISHGGPPRRMLIAHADAPDPGAGVGGRPDRLSLEGSERPGPPARPAGCGSEAIGGHRGAPVAPIDAHNRATSRRSES